MPGNDQDRRLQWQWIWAVDNHGHAWEQTEADLRLEAGRTQNPRAGLIPPPLKYGFTNYTPKNRRILIIDKNELKSGVQDFQNKTHNFLFS